MKKQVGLIEYTKFKLKKFIEMRSVSPSPDLNNKYKKIAVVPTPNYHRHSSIDSGFTSLSNVGQNNFIYINGQRRGQTAGDHLFIVDNKVLEPGTIEYLAAMEDHEEQMKKHQEMITRFMR